MVRAAVAVLTVAMAALVSAWPAPALVIEDLDGGARIGVLPAPNGTAVALRYRHSLHGGLVWERMRVRDATLVLETVEAEREAAAEYYRLAPPVRDEGGRYRIDRIGQPLPPIVVRATRLGERALIAPRGVLALGTAARDGHRIAITVRRWPRAAVWWAARATPWTQEEETTGG